MKQHWNTFWVFLQNIKRTTDDVGFAVVPKHETLSTVNDKLEESSELITADLNDGVLNVNILRLPTKRRVFLKL